MTGGLGKQFLSIAASIGHEDAGLLGKINPVFLKDGKQESETRSFFAFWAIVESFLFVVLGPFAYKFLVSWPIREHHRGSARQDQLSFKKHPRICLPNVTDRLKGAFAEDSTVCIKFPLMHLVFLLKRLSNLIKLKSFESNHKFLIANLSKSPYTFCVFSPSNPHSSFLSIVINFAGIQLARINQAFLKFTLY